MQQKLKFRLISIVSKSIKDVFVVVVYVVVVVVDDDDPRNMPSKFGQ